MLRLEGLGMTTQIAVTGLDLRAQREARGFSQVKLAELLDVHPKTITRLEGQDVIPRATAIAAAVVLAPPLVLPPVPRTRTDARPSVRPRVRPASRPRPRKRR
jgi:DNA-binding XRE family transcriptional regulator